MVRPRKPSLDRLRTLAWYEAVKQAVAAEEAKAVERVTPYLVGRRLASRGVGSSDESRQWYYYQYADRVGRAPRPKDVTSVAESGRRWDYEEGSHCPSDVTLNAVDSLYPGTRMIFDEGPHFSYLWGALDENPERVVTQIVGTWRQGVPLRHLLVRDGECYVEDVVVPERLAKRWNVSGGDILDLVEQCQPWEGFEDVCAKAEWPEFDYETCSGEEVLPFAPSLALPFLVGLSYRIALSRSRGENRVVLDISNRVPTTDFASRLLWHVQIHLFLTKRFKINIDWGEVLETQGASTS